jgi:hypothetical protein
MDYLTIIIVAAAALGFIGLAWIGGYELGAAEATDRERAFANRRVTGLLDELNKLKPRARAPKRRARK